MHRFTEIAFRYEPGGSEGHHEEASIVVRGRKAAKSAKSAQSQYVSLRIFDTATSPHPITETSTSSVRIYQRKRVSQDEILVMNTSVGIFDTDDGKARQFSIRTHPKSVQRRASSMLSQLLGGSESKLSLDDLERVGTVNEDYDAPICSSPTDMRVCNGWCDKSQKPSDTKPQGPNVVRIVIHMRAFSF